LTRTLAPATAALPVSSLTRPQTLNVLGGGGVTTAATVMCAVPVTPWYVARTSASPAATAVTNPVVETVATAEFDDSQLA